MKQRFIQSLLVLSLTLLAGCATTPTKGYCPVPVFPDRCALDWIATAETPPCVDNWLDRYARQQEALVMNCGK